MVSSISFSAMQRCFSIFTPEQNRPVFDLNQLRGKAPDEFEALWKGHLDDVKIQLKNAPEATRKMLEPMFQELAFDRIGTFFQHLIEQGEEIPEGLYDCIPLNKVSESNEELKKWAEEASEFLLEEIEYHEQRSQSNHRGNLVTRFIPNLTHIFMRSFTLLQAERPPDSIYEYGVLVTMYFNFFQLPYVFFKTLHSFIADPWIVLATGTLILGMAVGLLYSYLKWFKGCPSSIIHCENWSKEYGSRPRMPVIGRDKEYAEVKNCLDVPKAVLIYGAPGVGKTEFMKGLAAKFPEYRFFCLINGEVFSTNSYAAAPADKIREAFHDAEGNPKVVFCLDEFGDTLESSKFDLKAVLKPILGDNYPKIRFITALTTDQWNQVCEDEKNNDERPKNSKEDVALTQRFHAIELQQTSVEQTTSILLEERRILGRRIPISTKAIKKIVEKGGENLRNAQPRNDLDVLRYLATQVAQFNPENYVTDELRDAKDKLELIRRTGKRHKQAQDLTDAKAAVEEIEKKVGVQRQLAAKIMKLYRLRYEAQRLTEGLIWKIAKNQAVSDHDRVKVICLDTHYIPELKKQIKNLLPQLGKDIHLRLDTNLVESYYR